MSFPVPQLTPILFSGFIGWIYYRRIRGSFGRQPWRPLRSGIRLGILTLALLSLGMAAVFVPHSGLGIAAGMAVGGLLGALAQQHTHAELIDGNRFYTPNPWIGAALSVLLIGRLAWRMGSGVFTAGAAQASQNASPLTLALAAALVGYYLVYSLSLVLRMRALKADAPSA